MPSPARDRDETLQQPTLFAESLDSTPDCPHARAGVQLAPRTPRVISASKRTDMPAFYLHRLLSWVEAGWVDVPNPMYRRANDPLKRLTHVSLEPAHVRAIVWWSKNYGPYLKLHEGFAHYPLQSFQFTINPRRSDLAWLEPDVPPLEEAIRQAASLVEIRRQPDLISWRYDPLLFWREGRELKSTWDEDFFQHVCAEMSRIGIHRCFTSVADHYQKVQRRFARYFPNVTLRNPDEDEIAQIARSMGMIARYHGIEVHACTEPRLETHGGFFHGACIDGSLLQRHASPGAKVSIAKATDRSYPGRAECGCTLHTDIGDYEEHECRYSCVYCYANPNHRRFQDGARDAH
jgi:hypothetical protein